MLWGQRVSLGHKRAVCLQLKSVTPFSVLMDQSASSWLCCRPSTGCWLTAVFRSAAPSPPLGTLQQHSPSGHFHSLALKLLQGACGARGRPWVILGGVFSGGSQRGCRQPPWPSSVCTPGFLSAEPGGPQTLASRSTPGTPQTPHTVRRTLRSFHPLLTAPERARGEPTGRPIRGAYVISARRPAPPLNSGSRRRPVAAAADPVRDPAQLPRPTRPDPRRRAAWSDR